jgi:hypothetical protein
MFTASIFNTFQVLTLSGAKIQELYLKPAMMPLVGFLLSIFLVEFLKGYAFAEEGTWQFFASVLVLTVIVFGSVSVLLLACPYYDTVRSKFRSYRKHQEKLKNPNMVL